MIKLLNSCSIKTRLENSSLPMHDKFFQTAVANLLTVILFSMPGQLCNGLVTRGHLDVMDHLLNCAAEPDAKDVRRKNKDMLCQNLFFCLEI